MEKNIPNFLCKHDSLPRSQQVVIPSPVPNKSNPHHPFPFSLSSYYYFLLTSKWSRPFRISY